MKKLISLLLVLVLGLGLLPLSAAAATEVKEIQLTLEYPEAGQTPPGTATWLTQGYSIYSIDWYDLTADKFLEAGEKIQAGHKYRATLWVKSLDGFEFSAQNSYTPSVKAYVNGEECQASKAFEYNAWAMVCVDYAFPAVPSKGWIKSVDLNITAPVSGAKPDYTQLSSTSYASGNVSFGGSDNPNIKNGISWYSRKGTDLQLVNAGTGVFASNTEYTFFCNIFPRDGYAITRNATATVNGKAAKTSLEYDNFLVVEYSFPKTGEATHTHFYTDWQYNSGQHYKNCTDCDEVFFVESHKGGTATCVEKGKCTVCGYAYLETNENHTPDTSKWVARVDMYHYHKCKDCGAHCDIEDHKWSPTYLYKDASGHAWVCADCQAISAIEQHQPGAAATDDTPQTCKACGYIIQPALNHKHDLTKVPQTPATCTQPGNIEYWVCTGCNDCFTDSEGKNMIPETMSVEVGALGHTTGAWSCDEQFHWRTCTTCKAVLDETKMRHESVCTTCGYGIAAEEETPALLQWLKGIVDSWQSVVLVALVSFAVVITATVIVLKTKKKRGE